MIGPQNPSNLTFLPGEDAISEEEQQMAVQFVGCTAAVPLLSWDPLSGKSEADNGGNWRKISRN